MATNGSDDAPTRRRYLATAGGLVVGGALAGCSGSSDDGSTPTAGEAGAASTATESTSTATEDTATEETESEQTESEEAASGDAESEDAYSVSMAPVGEVTVESVPERWVPYCGGYADMGVALGQADGMAAIGGFDRYYTRHYDELDGVSVPEDRLQQYGLNDADMDKELFYEIDADVHVIDPAMLKNWFDWSQADVDEISENVGPFFGNLIFRRSDDWHDYRYYTMDEAFEKLAALFRERERFEAFRSLQEEVVAEVTERLPPEDQRPEVLLCFEGTDDPSSFSPYRLDDQGSNKRQWRELGAKDVLADTDISSLSTSDRGELDYETLLELDPEVILVRGHRGATAEEFREVVLGSMADHPVGSELQAVQNGQVYRGGLLHQGPIHHLFFLERGAKQLYPDVFGDVESDEQLFDRHRVAEIVTGGDES